MKNKKYMRIIVIAVLTVGIIAADSSSVFARMRHRKPVRHHPYYGKKVSLPDLLVKAVVIGGLEYYYHQGYFYRRGSGGYIIVDAPVGAMVETIPSGYKVVVINGKTYYYHNDMYFVRRGKKYAVVSDPVYQVVELPKEVQVIDVEPAVINTNVSPVAKQNNQAAVYTKNTFPVNIPNANGSYSQVKIVRAGNGFIGPQGEYYTEFPKVEQLKVMYGK